MCKFILESVLGITVFGLDHVLDRARNRVVDTQHGTFHQVNLPRPIPSQARASLPSTRLNRFVVRGAEEQWTGIMQRISLLRIKFGLQERYLLLVQRFRVE